MEDTLERLSNNLTHIVSGILELPVLGRVWRETVHTQTKINGQ